MWLKILAILRAIFIVLPHIMSAADALDEAKKEDSEKK